MIGDPWDGSLPWPWRSEGTDSAYGAGVLELLALVVTVDEVRAYHASRGIGGDDSWRALSDLGQQVFVHRLTYGAFGLHTHDWLRVAWSGALYWLGRLQFNLQRDPLDPAGAAAGTWVLSTHIPRSGPLNPAEVDASFAAARTFFAEHFAEFAVSAFHCHSWLLDPQLAAVLPATSNMALFQRRWTLAGEPGNGDEDAVFFTFARRPPVDLTSLPRDTTLQRAILDRLADGGHWHVCNGLIPYAGCSPTRMRPRRPRVTDLYIVRHGETEWSADGRHTSVTDLELTDNGVRQAESLRGHLDPASFGLILSSPRHRARRTAELAGFVGDHEPEVTEDLVEWFYGDYEGSTSAQIHQTDPGWTIFTHPTPGGETHGQVTERMDRLIERIRSASVDRAICFGHGHALRALTVRWMGLDLMWGAHFPLDTATISVLGEEKGVPALERWNAR